MSLSPPPASPAATCGQESPAGGPSCPSTPVKQSLSCRCIVLTILYYLLPPLNVFIGFSFQCDSPTRSAVIDNSEATETVVLLKSAGESGRDDDGLDEAWRDEAWRDEAELGESRRDDDALGEAGRDEASKEMSV